MDRTAVSRPTAADTITQAIIARLEAGTSPWVRPWTGISVSRPLRACGTRYRGINTIWLWMAAEAAGYSSPYWLTYRQAQLQGGQVRKGERGTVAIFYKSYRKEAEDEETGDADAGTRRVLKSFIVFNACQIDGLPERFFPAPKALAEPTSRDRELDLFFSSIPARLRHFGDEAYYRPVPDDITMPEPAAFKDLDHYRATLAHELSHWTGHASRLARDLAGRFGSDAYAVEELIAEMAAAMLGAELGHPGGIATVHANGALAALYRLEQLVQEAIPVVPKRLIAEAIDLIVFIEGRGTNRRIGSIAAVEGLDPAGDYAVRPLSHEPLSKETDA